MRLSRPSPRIIGFAGIAILATAIAAVGGCAGGTTRPINNVPRPPTLLPRSSASRIQPSLGAPCLSDDPDALCLGVKVIAYANPATGIPTLEATDVIRDMQNVNSVWSQCRIGFQVDNYSSVDPARHKLNFDTAESDDLTKIRNNFSTDKSLLLVSTGAWNRHGSLGRTPANAWTAMPGSGLYGAIIEQPVVTTPNMVAHELGHYLNLQHIDDATDLMNPVIYPTSGVLTAEQCDTARSAATTYWSKMLR
ncbi:MAG: hypothetical protein P4M08_09095 [Oligoflexia bacterium]|nr:hypothetical protein [Oligoflexia bacterium]